MQESPTDMDDFEKRFQRRREGMEEFARVMEECLAGETDVDEFLLSQDTEFWQFLDRIYIAGHHQNTDEVPWLASLTQVDDLGPNGRAMFLAFTALEALQEMPEAAFAEGKRLLAQLRPEASAYRKVGVGKVLAVSDKEEAVPLLQWLVEDESPYARTHVGWDLKALLTRLAERKNAPNGDSSG